MEKQIILGVFLSVVLFIFIIVLSGCSTQHIVKDCVKVEQENTWVCKNLKPWE